MSAEMLRRAAGLMRERAAKATPSPWESGTDGWVETVSGDGDDWCYVRQVGSKSDLMAQTLHGQECDEQTEADAEHIASWHPAVALAVADWLDRVAARWDGPKCNDPRGCCNNCEYDEEPLHALAVARAYLGEAADD